MEGEEAGGQRQTDLTSGQQRLPVHWELAPHGSSGPEKPQSLEETSLGIQSPHPAA